MKGLYEEAGVSLKNGYESVEKIKSHIDKTHKKGVISKVGQFSSMFDLSEYNYKEPVLFSGTDGVGTKILLAEKFNNFETIGIDLVAMSVNDIITQGADPLYFLDYIACGKNDPDTIEKIVAGIANGCVEADCSLVGGETAEMPDVYSQDSFDLAGFVVGCANKSDIIDHVNVEIDDIILGLPSSGLHANGYSLVRKILFKDNDIDPETTIDVLGCNLKTELLKPTKIYVEEVKELKQQIKINGMCHITGGGFQENIARCTNGHGAIINKEQIKILPIFNYLQQIANIPTLEMFNYFNMGIGYVFIINQSELKKALAINPELQVIGKIIKGDGVQICD